LADAVAGSDAVTRYCSASAAKDIDGIMSALAPDAEVISPLVGRMVFKGESDLRFLLEGVYSVLTGLRWDEPIGEGSVRAVTGVGRVSGLRLGDAMVMELGPDGRIVRVRPHLRPLLATLVFALRLGMKITRRPGILIRALRAGSAP
jgi:hypothetical protein